MDSAVLQDRILIVDDDPMVLRVIERSLRHAGFTDIRPVSDPCRAVREFSAIKPDLLILDLQMPELDGFGVMQKIRPLVEGETFLPILILTGNIAPDAKQRALSQGANDFLTKPFDRVELLLRVRNLLHTRALNRQLQAHNQLLEAQVSERTQELQAALAAAEAASQAKTDFLSMMSHELKTPLTSIISYAELLELGTGGQLTELHREQVGRISEGAWHLNELVEEILDFARGSSSHGKPNLQRVDLVYVLRQAIAWIMPIAKERRLAVRLEMPPEPLVWTTDANWVRRILLNLLSNAVKFTEEGGVNVRLIAGAESVTIHVEDTGIGIEPEHLDRIWEPFWQVDSPSTRRVGGMGLGLSVVRRLVEALDGRVEVVSTPGVGSTFTVTLV
jgi:two-component system, NtrC family, sensor kinase